MTKMKTVSVDEIAGKALSWAIASILGRALREPVYATYEDVRHLKPPFTLYDVDVTVADDDPDKITQALPVAVTVVHCNSNSDPLIVYRDRDGKEITSWLRFFFIDKGEAEIRALECLHGVWSNYNPADDWLECGKIIDEYGILFQAMDSGTIMAYLRKRGTGGPKGLAADHRTAALRCLVAAEYGPTVDVPADLVN